MKLHLFPVLAALALPSLSLIQAQDMCAQVIQPAVSPGGICQEYSTPCDVPEDYKAVPSCDLIDQSDQTDKPSLEQKMQSRRAQMRAYWAKKKAAQDDSTSKTDDNNSFNRFGSGSLTRSNRARRLPTSDASGSNSAGVRAFTEKDYSSDISKRYSLRGGYQREGDTTSAERKERRAYRAPTQSRSDAKRTGKFNTTVKWNVMSRQFTSKKNYGINPYRLSSKYKEQQKAKRAESNQEIDVHARMMSRSRKYRGARLEGNMSGDDLFLQRQGEAEAEARQDLNE